MSRSKKAADTTALSLEAFANSGKTAQADAAKVAAEPKGEVVPISPSQYPQGDELVMLRPPAKKLGSNEQMHFNAIERAIEAHGTDGHLACDTLAASLDHGRKSIRRVARAGGLAHYRPFKAKYGIGAEVPNAPEAETTTDS